jgi:hypothetical protein
VTEAAEKATETGPLAHHPSEHDVNELARAAIARLRPSNTAAQSSEEPVPPREPRHVMAAATPAAPPETAVQRLPAPVTVSAPASERPRSRQDASQPMAIGPDAATVADNDSGRLVPPADIPLAPLLNLSSGNAQSSRQTTVADDMLSTAKSVFHAVLPH